MLLQIECKMDKKLYWEDGYSLYALLLSMVPREMGDKIHGMQMTPISQKVLKDRWIMTLMGEETAEVLAEPILQLSSFDINKGKRHVEILEKKVSVIDDIDHLYLEAPEKQFELKLQTPVAFKSRQQYQLLPANRLILQSLIRRWNFCFPLYPISEEEENVQQMAEMLHLRALRLESEVFRTKGAVIPGVTGSMSFESMEEGETDQILRTLIALGNYTGIGIKTAIGMGGVKTQ